MDLTIKSCAFTGHRKLLEDFDKKLLKKKIIEMIELYKVGVFYCGMAMGFDLVAGEIVSGLKKKYDVKLIACVPCPEQEKFFNEKDKKLYKKIAKKCDEIKLISDHYFSGCMQVRNKFMVDRSDFVIAYVRESEGGTRFTVDYAVKNKKTVVMV